MINKPFSYFFYFQLLIIDLNRFILNKKIDLSPSTNHSQVNYIIVKRRNNKPVYEEYMQSSSIQGYYKKNSNQVVTFLHHSQVWGNTCAHFLFDIYGRINNPLSQVSFKSRTSKRWIQNDRTKEKNNKVDTGLGRGQQKLNGK